VTQGAPVPPAYTTNEERNNCDMAVDYPQGRGRTWGEHLDGFGAALPDYCYCTALSSVDPERDAGIENADRLAAPPVPAMSRQLSNTHKFEGAHNSVTANRYGQQDWSYMDESSEHVLMCLRQEN